MIQVEPTALPEVKIIRSDRFGDVRGFFSEVYNKRALEEAGISLDFVQENHSLSARRGTVRGLHFQTVPFAQTKLIRVSRGRILDVAVDLRRSSPTFGCHVAVELSSTNWLQLLIPDGFAHGFCTLDDETEVQYRVTAYYSAEHERGISWNDEELGIPWPVKPEEAVVSEKDGKLLPLSESCDVFA